MAAVDKQLHGLWTWLDERIGLGELGKLVQKKEVPVHRHTIWYYLGGMTLFLFLIPLYFWGLVLVLLLCYEIRRSHAITTFTINRPHS